MKFFWNLTLYAKVRLVKHQSEVHTLTSFPATVSRLKGAQAELDKVMAQLKEKQEKLAAIEAKVNIGIAHIPSMAKPFIGIA